MSVPVTYLASSNLHKLQEFRQLLEPSFAIASAAEIGGMPAVDENGSSFEANAILKARALLQCAPDRAAVLADDSGLCVDALNGQPGIHSARFAGPGASDEDNNTRLLRELQAVPSEHRTAYFVCVLVWCCGEQTIIASGRCDGEILLEPSGMEGFGYDPLFRPVGDSESFAALGASVKSAISHRAAACAELLRLISREFPS